MGIFEPQAVAQLSTVIDDVCKALEQQDCAIPLSAKKAIAIRIVELYECGITDPDRLLLEIMADSLWASSNQSFPCLWAMKRSPDEVAEAPGDNDKAQEQSLGMIQRRLGKVQKRIHQQNNVIAAMMRRRLNTDDAELLLCSLLRTAATLRSEYDNLLNDIRQPTSDRTRVQRATAYSLIDEARAYRSAATARLRTARLAREAAEPG